MNTILACILLTVLVICALFLVCVMKSAAKIAPEAHDMIDLNDNPFFWPLCPACGGKVEVEMEKGTGLIKVVHDCKDVPEHSQCNDIGRYRNTVDANFGWKQTVEDWINQREITQK